MVACVAKVSKDACSEDRTWARCAVEVGPYADGGPPAPYIKRWDEEEDP